MIKRVLFIFIALVCIVTQLYSQSFRVEDIKNMFGKGKPLKISGGLSANTVTNAGNATSGREAFTYYMNGNINLNLFGQVNLPFLFNFTNSGSSYQLPSSPNRLSIHPSYKWVTGHIGDVSMTFSPYTLNGHMFSGVGVEMTPDGWEFAAMYGRLQKAVDYQESQPGFLPTYKRMGYGFKVGKIAQNYQVSVNIFSAKDQESSQINLPDSLGITPMENLAGSVSVLFKPTSFLEISGEYGLSLMTNDTRLPDDHRSGILGAWSGSNMSSTYYNAFKLRAEYVSEVTRFGIGYERIDPDYKTLGAYYFTNDLENITVNGYRSMWDNKLSVDLSLGYERDNLSGKKATDNTRVIGSVNVTANLSERFMANVSYSNFQSYSNMKSNFELINQEITMDNIDTLDYKQISQSLNLNLNLITKKSEIEIHNLNVNLAYQDAANKQSGKYQPGSVTEMINAASSYTVSFLKTGVTLNAALNVNNSRVHNGNTFAWGPTVGASSQFLKKKMKLSGSTSYNTASLEGTKQNEVFMVRTSGSYNPAGRHTFTLAYTFQWRSALNREDTNNSLITAGYNYSF